MLSHEFARNALLPGQRGMELLKFCQGKLADAENKIRVFDQGTLTLPLTLQETDLPDVD